MIKDTRRPMWCIESMIAQAGTISANHDATIGRIIADAMEQVGKDRVITVDEARTIETTP